MNYRRLQSSNNYVVRVLRETVCIFNSRLMVCWGPVCIKTPPGERAVIAELATLLDIT